MKKMMVCVFLFMAGAAESAMAGNFSHSCEELTLQGSRLNAECRKRDQRSQPTSLNLDKKIGNLDGTLSWGDRNFSQSCSHITLDGATLTAVCKRRDGSPNQTSLNLDEGIDNTNGVLRFD